MNAMILHWAGIILAIIVVDLTLSGDNALVIGAAASKLQGRARGYAITFGGVMAIILRIVLASGAVLLLQIPYVKAIGGLAVFWIALQLVRDLYNAENSLEVDKRSQRFGIGNQTTFFRACLTIVVADISMSTDNVLAIAALAQGNFLVLAIGLALSIAFLLVASSFIAKVIERFPLLLALAGAILAFTAGSLILSDHVLEPTVNLYDKQIPGPPLAIMLQIVFVAIFTLVALVQYWLRPQTKQNATANSGKETLKAIPTQDSEEGRG